MSLDNDLRRFGLNKTERAIYLFLLEQGLSSPPAIARGTGVARTNTYHVLQSLRQKGLISSQLRGKRKTYIANDPTAFLRNLEKKKEAIERLLPDLRALHKLQRNKPKIKFFQGKKEIKEVYRLATETDKIYAIGSTNAFFGAFPEFHKWFLKELDKKNVVITDILSHASKETLSELKGVLGGYHDYGLLPSKYGEFPTDMLIWKGHIAMINLQEPMFATLIADEALAATMQLIFRFMKDALDRE